MFISPMLLHKSDQPFDDSDYITELKLDGIRIIWTKFNDQVKIYTRHNTEVTNTFPELLDIDVPNGTVLDGEIIVTSTDGKPDFEAMMERFKSRRSKYHVQYCVFDVIYYEGSSVTHLPLIERKKLLQQTLPIDHKNVVEVKWLYGRAEDYYGLVVAQDLEGIVQKKASSLYAVDKRSYDWLKVINYKYTDIYIRGLRNEDFGLLLSFEDGRHAGLMEFMAPKNRKEFYKKYNQHVISEDKSFVYFDPIKCHVKYRNLTKKGLLRIPSFVSWSS